MQDTTTNHKIYLLQWLVFVAMVAPAFFTLPQKNEVVSSQTYVARADTAKQSWSEIPKRAVTLSEVQSYTDQALTIKAKKMPVKTQLKIKALTGEVFELSDGTFISAVKKQVGSDVIQETELISQDIYVTKKANVLYAPLTTFDNQVYSELTGGEKLHADKKAVTNWGIYYEVSFDGGKTGWVESSAVTLKNPKLDKVQALLNQKYNNPNYSIYVKQLDSEFTIGVNQTKMMYSASLSKLPILYWTQKQINAGNASLGDKLQYDALVNSWVGAFKADGTGFLPKTADNQFYTILDLINRTAKDSDNVGSNILAYYETNKFSADYQAAIAEIAGQKWDPVTREASSEMVGRILEALYHEGGAGFNALIGTDYDADRIPAKIPQTVKVAHKIGTADEFNHDAALVLTSEPYILVIETNNEADNDELANISKDIYEVMT